MKYPLNLIIMSVLAFILSACNFFTPPQTQTLDLLVDNSDATQISALRGSATSQSDLLMGTLEAVNTSVRAVEQQSTRIASTLIAQGTTVVDVSHLTPFSPTQLAFGNPGVNSALFDQSVQPFVTPGGGALGNVSIDVTPTQPAINFTEQQVIQPTQEVINVNTPQLTNITLTLNVGADDCPIGSASSISSTANDIYVTAYAQNLTASNTLTSRWMLEGTEMVTYSWSPSGNINGACIWFHMPASAVTYTPGNWSVEVLLNGTVSATIPFSITGS